VSLRNLGVDVLLQINGVSVYFKKKTICGPFEMDELATLFTNLTGRFITETLLTCEKMVSNICV